MSTLVIEGGHRIEGRVDVEGNKNAALPLLAACLLTDEWCTLENMPRIADVEVMARLLLDLGAEVEGIGSTTLRIRCVTVTKDEPDSALVGRLRGSVLLLGPLLARRGRAVVAPPGGDFPARRSIKTHLEALHAMGARVIPGSGHRIRRGSVPGRSSRLNGAGEVAAGAAGPGSPPGNWRVVCADSLLSRRRPHHLWRRASGKHPANEEWLLDP